MINKLTKKQESKLDYYKDKWLKIGLSTSDCDREAAQEAAKDAYKIAGLDEPKLFIWSNSPIECAMQKVFMDKMLSKCGDQVVNQVGEQVKGQVWEKMWEQVNSQVWEQVENNKVENQVKKKVLLQVRRQVGDQVRKQVGDQVRKQVGDQVRKQVGDQVRNQVWNQVGEKVREKVWEKVQEKVREQVWEKVWEQVGEQVKGQVWEKVENQVWEQVGEQVQEKVWNQVRNQVREQVRKQVWEQVWEQVREQVWNQVRNQVREQVKDQIYGSHDSGWLSFYDFFLNECNIKECEVLKPLMKLAENCGWWAPYKNICFMQEKPKYIVMENKKLHNPNGPSVEYRDGFSVYSLFGVRIEKEMLNYNAKQILKVKNAEQRMVLIKNMGIDSFIDYLNPTVKNKYKDYELLEIEIEKSKERLLKMRNPSENKYHFEFVPPRINTCQEAMAWRCGFTLYTNPNFQA